MKLQEPPNYVSRCVQFSSTAVDYVDPEDGCSKIYPLIGGLSRDTRYAWISRGPNFEVVSTDNGEKVAAWTFGGILKDTNTKVTCAVELPTVKDGYGVSVSSMFAVGLDCYLSYGMVCLFDTRGSRIIKAIQVPGKVSSLAIVDSGLIPEATTPLAPALRLAKGLLAVGLSPGGNVLLLDLCLSDEDGTAAEGVPSVEEEYVSGPSRPHTEHSDELHPSHTVIHTPGDPRTEGPVSPGEHIAILLNECSFNNGFFMLNLADSTYRLPPTHVEITASLYVPQLASLFIGFSFGCFQVWDLSNLTLVHTSALLSEPRNISFFAFQEPADDPRKYCYIWAVYGRRWDKGGKEGEEKGEGATSGDPNEDGRDDLAFACMHDMYYESKEWIDGYGWLYQDFVSISRRFELEFSHGNESHSISRCISCHSVDGHQGRGRANYAGRMETSDFEEGCAAENESLCCMIWQSWQMGRDGTPCNLRHSLTLFDLNQWYREQMPCNSAPLVISSPDPNSDYMSGGIERHPGSPHLLTYALPFVTEKVLSENGAPLLFARIDPTSISRFCATATSIPEEHLFPSALSFESSFLLGSQCVIKMSTPGLQRSLLAKLQSLGTKSYLYPTPIFYECVAAGLKPLYVDIDNPTTTPVSEQREFLLSLALEHHMVSYLIKCAVETADGRAGSLGVTLGFLMSWVKERSWVIKECINQLNVPLFECGGALFPDPQASRLRSLSGRQLSHLSTLLKEILRQKLSWIVIDVAQEIEKWSEVLGVLALHTGVVQWFCHNGLLPELADEDCEAAEIQASSLGVPRIPYPAKVLSEAYEKRRKELLALPGVLKVSDVLFIDGAVKECGEQLTKDNWQTKGSEISGQYPPPSLQALLLTYLLDGLPVEDKHCLVIYLFLDLAALLSRERYGSSLSQLIKFPSAFSLSPSIIKLTQAFWLLDHKDFEVAINVFLDPLICPQDIKLWQHRCVVRAFLSQGEPQKALKYVRVHQPPLGGLEDLKLNLTLLLENGLVHEAFNYQRKHCNDQNSKELLQHFFNGCGDLKQLRWVLQNSLTPSEEDGLIAFLSSQKDAKAQEIRVMYYLQRSRVIEALRINDSEKPNKKDKRKGLDNGRNKNLKTVRDAIVTGYASALPSVTRRLAAYCARHSGTVHSWKEVTRPVPMSVNIHHAKQEPNIPFRTKSTLMGTMLDKARETWNPPPLSPILPPTPRPPPSSRGLPSREKRKRDDEEGMDIMSILPSRKVQSSPMRSSVESMPFICTPVAPSQSRSRNGEGPPLVFPHQSKSLLDFDGSRTPSKRARLASNSKIHTSSPLNESTMDMTSSVSSALLLLRTPTVPKRNRKASYGRKPDGEECSTTGSGGSTPTHDMLPQTPQSILKVRKTRDASLASPSSVQNGSNMMEEEHEEDNEEGHGLGRLIRFQLPTGLTPSPLPSSPVIDTHYNLRERLGATPRQPLQRSPLKGLTRQPLPSMEHQPSPAKKSPHLTEIRKEVSSTTKTKTVRRVFRESSEDLEGSERKAEKHIGPKARSAIHLSMDKLRKSHESECGSADESGEFYSFEEMKESPEGGVKATVEKRLEEETFTNDSYGKLFASPYLQVKTRRQSSLFRSEADEPMREKEENEDVEEDEEMETEVDKECAVVDKECAVVDKECAEVPKESVDQKEDEIKYATEDKQEEEMEGERFEDEAKPDEEKEEHHEGEVEETETVAKKETEEIEGEKVSEEDRISESKDEEQTKAEEYELEEMKENEVCAEKSYEGEASEILELGTSEISEEEDANEQEGEPKSSSIEEVPIYEEDEHCSVPDGEEYATQENQYVRLKEVEPLRDASQTEAVICQSEDDDIVVISDSDDEQEEHEMQANVEGTEVNWEEEEYEEEMEEYSKEGARKGSDGGREWFAQWEKESGIKGTQWTDQEEEEGLYAEEGEEEEEVEEVNDEMPPLEVVGSKIRGQKGDTSKSLIKRWMDESGLEESVSYEDNDEDDEEEVDDEDEEEEVDDEDEDEEDDEDDDDDDDEDDDEEEEEEEEEYEDEEEEVVEVRKTKEMDEVKVLEMEGNRREISTSRVDSKFLEEEDEKGDDAEAEIEDPEEVESEEDKEDMEEMNQVKDLEEEKVVEKDEYIVERNEGMIIREVFSVEHRKDASRGCRIAEELSAEWETDEESYREGLEEEMETEEVKDTVRIEVGEIRESREEEMHVIELLVHEAPQEQKEDKEVKDAIQTISSEELVETEECDEVEDAVKMVEVGEIQEFKREMDAIEVLVDEVSQERKEDKEVKDALQTISSDEVEAVEDSAEVIGNEECKNADEVQEMNESIESRDGVEMVGTENIEEVKEAEEFEEGKEAEIIEEMKKREATKEPKQHKEEKETDDVVEEVSKHEEFGKQKEAEVVEVKETEEIEELQESEAEVVEVKETEEIEELQESEAEVVEVKETKEIEELQESEAEVVEVKETEEIEELQESEAEVVEVKETKEIEELKESEECDEEEEVDERNETGEVEIVELLKIEKEKGIEEREYVEPNSTVAVKEAEGRAEVEEMEVEQIEEDKSQRKLEAMEGSIAPGEVVETSLVTAKAKDSHEETSNGGGGSQPMKKDVLKNASTEQANEETEIVLVLESDDDEVPSERKENGSMQITGDENVESATEVIAQTPEMSAPKKELLVEENTSILVRDKECSEVKGHEEVGEIVEESVNIPAEAITERVIDCREEDVKELETNEKDKGMGDNDDKMESLGEKVVANEEDKESVKVESIEVLEEMKGEKEKVVAEEVAMKENLSEPEVMQLDDKMAAATSESVSGAEIDLAPEKNLSEIIAMKLHSQSTSVASIDGSDEKIAEEMEFVSEPKESEDVVPKTEAVETLKVEEEEMEKEKEQLEEKHDMSSQMEEYATSRRLTRHQMALLSKSIGVTEVVHSPSTPQSAKKRATKAKTPPRNVQQNVSEATSSPTPTLPTTPLRSSARIRNLAGATKGEKSPVAQAVQQVESKERAKSPIPLSAQQLGEERVNSPLENFPTETTSSDVEPKANQEAGKSDDEGQSSPLQWSLLLEERYKKFRRTSPAGEFTPRMRTRRSSRASISPHSSASTEIRQSPELRESPENRLLPEEKERVGRRASPAPSVASSIASSVSLRRRSTRGKVDEERVPSPFEEAPHIPRTRGRSVEPESNVIGRSTSPALSVASSVASSVSQRERRRSIRGRVDEERLLTPIDEVSHVRRTRRRSVEPDTNVIRSPQLTRRISQSPDSGSEASSYTSSVTSTRSHHSQAREELVGEEHILRSGKKRPPVTPTKSGPRRKRTSRHSIARMLEIEQEEVAPENLGNINEPDRAFVFSPPTAVFANLQARFEEMKSIPEFPLSPPKLISHPPLPVHAPPPQRRFSAAYRRSVGSLGPISEVVDEEEIVSATPSPRRGRPPKGKLLPLTARKKGKQETDLDKPGEAGGGVVLRRRSRASSSRLLPIDEQKAEEEVSEKPATSKRTSSSQKHRSSPVSSTVSEGALDLEDDPVFKDEEVSNRTKDDSDALPRRRKSSSRSSLIHRKVPYKPRKSAKL